MPKKTALIREPAGSAHRSKSVRVLFAVFGLVITSLQVVRLTGVVFYTRIRGRLSARSLVVVAAMLATMISAYAQFSSPSLATAAPANNINFQARLETTAGSIAADGNYNVRFRLYNTSTGGSALWTENYLVNNSSHIRTANGYITANLGSITAFPGSINWGQQMYLTMEIGGTGSVPTWDGEMSPRLALTSVPSAFALNSFNSANGFTGSLTVAQPTGGNQVFTVPDQGAAGNYSLLTSIAANAAYIQNQNTAPQTTSNFYISGNGRASTSLQAPSLDAVAATALTIGATNATSITLGKANVLTTVNGGLTVATGSTFTNASSTVLTARILSLSASGAIGSAATTVDVATNFNITATNTSLNFTLPTPTASTTAGRLAYVNNTGTNTFTMYGIEIVAGAAQSFVYNGSNWTSTGAFSASGFIQNQSAAPQTNSNFYISDIGRTSGSFRADTSVLTPTLDTATISALNIGTTNATAINLNKNVVVAANQSLRLAGGSTANRPVSPAEGTLFFDTATSQLITYSNGKWQSDRSAASIIIAPSNASQAAKDSADIVLTGSADQTLINTALTSVAGGTVYIMEGTVTVSAAISIPNNTTLAGAGNGTIITLPNAQNSTYNVIQNTDTTTGAGIVIRSLTINGNRANQTSGVMNGVSLTNVGQGGGLSSRDSTLITGVTINRMFGASANGILLTNSSGVRINGVQLVHNGAYGIRAVTSSYISVTGSVFQGNGQGVGASAGVTLVSTNQSTVSGSVFDLNGTASISVTGSSNIISGNNVSNSSWGILIDTGGTFNSVTGNTVRNVAGNGGVRLIGANDNTVSANNVYNGGGTTNNEGILLSDADRNTITGNTVNDTSATITNYAIHLSDSASANNYVAGNTLGTGVIQNLGTTTIFGGQVDGTNNYLVQPTGTIELLRNTNVTGTLSVSALTTLSGGATVRGNLTVNTTTVTDDQLVIAVTAGGAARFIGTITSADLTANRIYTLPNESGTICTNATAGACAGLYIQNQNAAPQATSNFYISGSGRTSGSFRADTSLQTPLLDTATATALNIGTTNATVINLNKSVTVAANQSLTLVGGTTALRPAAPTEGMLFFDTTTKQLLTYSNGKWQADRTDAVIVAATNSSQSDRDAADFVANGNTGAANDGDQIEINQALTAAAGKKVILLAGTYVADAGISVPDTTTLSGIGNGTIVQFSSTSNANLIQNSNTIGSSSIVIENMFLDGLTLASPGTQNGIRLIDVGSVNSNRTGATIRNITATRFDNGAFLSDMADLQLENNTFLTNGAGLILEDTFSSVVKGNLFNKNGNGLEFYTGSDNVIANNRFHDQPTYGILLNNGSINTIADNAFDFTSTRSIFLDGSNDTNVTGNIIRESGSSTNNNAIFLANSDRSVITGNIVFDGSATSTNFAVNVSNGISDNTYIAGNSLNGSIINDLGTNTEYGGQISGTTYVIQPASGSTIGLLRSTNITGGLSVSALSQLNGGATIRNDLTVNTATATDDQLIIRAANVGGSRFNGIITNADLTDNQTYTLPNLTGEICIKNGNCESTVTTSNGAENKVARFSTATNLSTGLLWDTGTYAGVNIATQLGTGTFGIQAAASQVGLIVQGAATGQNIAEFRSSGGTTYLSIGSTGTITASQIASGIVTSASGVLSSVTAVPVANGGTGLTATPTNGQLPIGNGTGFTLATITQGSNIAITNGSGTISVATVQNPNFTTSVQTPLLRSANGTTLTVDSGTTGALDIGTSADAKIVTIGNSTVDTRVNINVGIPGFNVTGNSNFGGSLTLIGTANINASGAAVSNIGTANGAVNIGGTSSQLTINSTNFRVNTGGNVNFTAATADNSSYLCRNSTGQIAACNTAGNGVAFVQGGNNFGASDAVLGTTNSQALLLRTNNTTRLNISNTGVASYTGNFGITGDLTVTGAGAFTLAAGKSLSVTASATPTTDLVIIGNTAGTAVTGNAINGQQITFFGAPTGLNINSAQRLNVTNVDTTAGGQVQGLRITAVGAGGAIASDTVGIFIDNFTNSSTGSAGENALEIGTGWDNILQTASIRVTGAGAITGATGITSSGTITFSGLSDGFVTATGGTLGSTTTIGTASGGTGLSGTPSNGQLLIGNGTGYTLNPLTTIATNPNLQIINGAGTIQLGTVANPNFTTSVTTPIVQNTSGNLVVQGSTGIVSLGTSTQLTANAALTVQPSTALNLFASGNNSLTLDTTLVGAINIGTTTANTKTITLGNSAGTINANVGAGGFNVNGNANVTGTINTNTFTNSALQFSGSPTISTAVTNGNLAVRANGNGTLTLDTNGAGTVAVGGTATNVNIGTVAGSATTIMQGSSNSGTTVRLQGGSNYLYATNNGIGINTTAPVTALDIVGSSSNRKNNLRTYRDVYMYSRTTSGTDTGVFELNLPNSFVNSMLRFRIIGYNQGTGSTWTADISAYNNSVSSLWQSGSAIITGPAPFTQVRFAQCTGECTNTNTVLLLGNASTSWVNTQIAVETVTAGFANQDLWGSGYSHSFVSPETPTRYQKVLSITPVTLGTVSASDYFVQGGNSFSAAAVLGTNDAQNLLLRTAGITRLTFDQTGTATFSSAISGTTISTSSTITANGLVTANAGLTVRALTNTTPLVQLQDSAGSVALQIRTGAAADANTFIGMNVAAGNVQGSGERNTALGFQSMRANTTGNNNTAIGYNTLQNATSGSFNTTVGISSLNSATTGSGNVAIGFASLFNNNGGGNVAIGANTGLNNTGSGNVFLGNEVGRNETGSDKLYIDNSSTGTPLIQGDFAADTLNVNGIFTVSATSAAYAAIITNNDTSTNADGLLIQLGVANNGRSSSNRFIDFGSTNGTTAGKIQGGTNSVAFTTNGADFAEYFRANPNDLPVPGELVAIDVTRPNGVRRATAADNLTGIIATSAGFIGNGPICRIDDNNCDADYAKYNVLVSLTGQVPVKTNGEGGVINIGDPIGASSIEGIATKAMNRNIVGYALTTPDENGLIQLSINISNFDPAKDLQAASVTTSRLNLNGDAFVSGELNVSGASRLASLVVSGPAVFESNLTVSGITSVAKIIVSGHILSQSAAPIVAKGTAAGIDGQVSIDGTDVAGTLSVTVQAQQTPQGNEVITSGVLADITFASPFEITPRIVISPLNEASVGAPVYLVKTATGYQLMISQAPASGTSYQFDYVVVGSAQTTANL